jgi:hypothetical protein
MYIYIYSDANGLEAASDGGYLVNAELCARSKVYVAGPSANIRHALFGRMHVEGEEDSWTSGVCAGRNMAGDRSQYTHVVSNNSIICIYVYLFDSHVAGDRSQYTHVVSNNSNIYV